MSEEASIIGGFILILLIAIFLTWACTSIGDFHGHIQLGSAGHTCFANHTCRENLTCHYGAGDMVGVCLGGK